LNILLVEDEPILRHGLADLLEGGGHVVEAVGDGPTALARGTKGPFDMVVLDIAVPGLDGDGFEVCRQLRSIREELLILILTARGREEDKVRGLGAGADDYVTKPFGARELLARVEALSRRLRREPSPDQIEADGCKLDLGRCLAVRADATVPLTAREARILRLLHTNRNRAITRAELLEQVWGASGRLQTRTVDMTIANLRQKIERDSSEPRIVVTVKGVGYAWGAQ
jgi:two-component system alkaline phosphatase synthesis response regulator PhoP